MSFDSPRRGSCLCGAIRYELSAEKPVMYNVCHCIDCQKSSGSAFVANLGVHKEEYEIVSGQGTLKSYSTSSTSSGNTLTRWFCAICGSSMFETTTEDKNLVMLQSGTLDDATDWKPVQEIFCVRRRPWLRRIDGVPQYEKLAPES
ncbi:hypothetical protein CONPUDRAFT_131066 [Coniophora puteana RWD-64-598 SS2]|uniref:CENP-V/GFA domain-containing protein n=1 Tax=Coniophora puteana (strain RWD-64-598) TaxID=741705 RepID=A0A5M3MBQ0_CONPW|nr:uncharacterized protein CONPUDRAFT_131066 [Coniophora puteana RWD-64-598 SS2]EIW76436.1 hypothetical protein CONPUDRAFT_131066 [Coniophora puteana RWD-64-598 SS2]